MDTCVERGHLAGMLDTRRDRSMRMGHVLDGIPQRVEDCPDMSTREVSTDVNVPHLTVWRVLGNGGLRPYHAQKV